MNIALPSHHALDEAVELAVSFGRARTPTGITERALIETSGFTGSHKQHRCQLQRALREGFISCTWETRCSSGPPPNLARNLRRSPLNLCRHVGLLSSVNRHMKA